MRRSPEQHTPQEKESAIDYYIEQGRFDLGKLSPDKLSDLFVEYMQRFETLDSDTQTEILEQFLLLRICTEKEARHFIERLPDRSRAEITEYMGKVLPGQYLELFHDNWDFLSYELQDFFKKKFIEEQPEYMLMIAPFVDLDRVFTKNPDDPKPRFYISGLKANEPPRYRSTTKEKEPTSVSFLEKYGNTFDFASTLMSVCLRRPHDSGLRGVIYHYDKQDPYFLFPYMPQLLEKGLYAPGEARTLITGEKRKTYHYAALRAEFYYTPEEQKKYREILQQVQKIKSNIIPEKNLPYRIDDWPKNFQEKKAAIDCEAQKRGMHHMFGNFKALSDTVLTPEDRLKTFDQLIEKQVPLFFAARELNLSKEDMRHIVVSAENRGDDINFLRDFTDVKILIDLGMEDIVTTTIISQIKESGAEYISQALLSNAEKIETWFSEKNSKRIFKEINTTQPQAWFSRLDFVFERQIISFSSLIKEATADGDMFLFSYLKILEAIRRAEKEGKNIGMTVQELKEMGKAVFEQHPNTVFWSPARFRDLYTPEQQKEFITRHLRQDENGDFLQKVLSEFSIWKARSSHNDQENSLNMEPYEKELRELFVSRVSLFANALEEDPSLWGTVYVKILSPADRFTVLLPALAETNLHDIIKYGSKEFLLDIASRPSALRKFFHILHTQNDLETLAAFTQVITEVLPSSEKPTHNIYRNRNEEKSIPLPNEIRNLLEKIKSTSVLAIQRLIEANHNLAFNETVLRIKNPPKFYEYITRVVEANYKQYIRFHPYDLPLLESRVSKEDYEAMMRINLRAPAFLRNRYGAELYNEEYIRDTTSLEIDRMNPLARFDFSSSKKLENDYYALVLDMVRDNPFFHLYQTPLEKIAKQELARNGPRTQIEYYSPDHTFLNLITRISLFASVPEVVAQQDAILNLPPAEQEEYFKTLELILLYAFDKEDDTVYQALHILKEDPIKSKQMLLRVAQKFSAPLFDLYTTPDVSEQGSIPELTAGTIRASMLYYGAVAQKNPATKLAFQNIIKHLLRGNFEQWRWWGNAKKNPISEEQTAYFQALKEQQLLPAKLTIDQYHHWLTPDSRSLEETLELSDNDVRTGIEQIFSQAIADQHITLEEFPVQYHDAKEEYDRFFDTITEPSTHLEELRFKVQTVKSKKGREDTAEKLTPEEEKEYKYLQRLIADFRIEHAEEITRLEARMYLTRLKTITLRDIETRTITIGAKQIPFQKAFQSIESVFSSTHPDFIQDIKRTQSLLFTAVDQLFGGERVSRSALRVTDAFNFETYFKIGEEPVPSCQSYASTSNLNEGLLSYVADPDVKIIQVYDEHGKIIARSVLRLLENDEGVPELFLERIYSVNAHQKINQAIIAFAKMKAKEIGSVLDSHIAEGDTEGDEVRVTNLYSRNSRSAYVYTDAGGGKMKKGIFTIRGAHAVI